MAANTPMLLKAGLVEGNTDAGVLASGVAGILDDLSRGAGARDRRQAVAHLRSNARIDLRSRRSARQCW
jgi:nitronate monooxygenase